MPHINPIYSDVDINLGYRNLIKTQTLNRTKSFHKKRNSQFIFARKIY